MKTYSITEVAEHFNMTAHTLRYYDKEGLMPFIERTSSGKRVLMESDIEFLERKASVEAQMEELKKTMEVIEHKCLYYKTALAGGTEDVHKQQKVNSF